MPSDFLACTKISCHIIKEKNLQVAAPLATHMSFLQLTLLIFQIRLHHSILTFL